MYTLRDLTSIAQKFSIEGEPLTVTPYGQGHLHDTFRVEMQGGAPDFILQRINNQIFKDIPGMMDNIHRVTGHMRIKLSQMPGHDPEREAMRLIPSASGANWLKDERGNYWRMYLFIPDAVVYQKVDDPGLAYEAGRLTGLFQWLLSDLGHPLVETLPRFHDIHHRIDQYLEAKEEDSAGRMQDISEEAVYAESRFDAMRHYLETLGKKAVIRVTHNDTKINNILFNADGRALCLIDLDTVMPGYVHFDYGDALRTLACTSDEDERDLSLVHFNMELYDAYTLGYLSTAIPFLSPREKLLLPFSPIYLTFIIGLRFLTDYINGDRYFKVHREGHNLDRARVQFRLAEDMARLIPGNQY